MRVDKWASLVRKTIRESGDPPGPQPAILGPFMIKRVCAAAVAASKGAIVPGGSSCRDRGVDGSNVLGQTPKRSDNVHYVAGRRVLALGQEHCRDEIKPTTCRLLAAFPRAAGDLSVKIRMRCSPS